jgi:hypothetical protein
VPRPARSVQPGLTALHLPLEKYTHVQVVSTQKLVGPPAKLVLKVTTALSWVS